MKARKVLAIDTEDDSEGTVSIINFFDGSKHQTFTAAQYGESLRERAWDWLYKQAPATLWACNAEYDLINLCGEWVGTMLTLQYVSSGLLRASFRDVAITVLDTLRHWPMSVEQMGAYLKLPKLDRDFRSVEYCRRDTEIVWRFVTAMLGRYDALGLTLRATLPAMALQLFTKRFYKRPFVKLPDATIRWLRRGYYGGRVEVYRFGVVEGPVRHYDVNSLFPSVMVRGQYPDPASWQVTKRPDWTKEGMADVTLSLPETAYPGLPMRGESDIVYPYGVLRGTWCYPEIRQALQDGATILHVTGAVEFTPVTTPFASYIRFCYKRRQQAPHALDNVLWKLYMNSLYGKFGQRPGLEMIFDDRLLTLPTHPSAAANVIWAAYVTCLARLRLLDYLRACSTCYYTDTDSLFTPDQLAVGPKLGQLKCEGEYDRIECVGNKLYAVEANGPHGGCRQQGPHEHFKAKGVKGEQAARDFIRTGRAVYRRPARLRESRRSFARANIWYDVEKHREAVYTKRVMLENGHTAPWEWSAYQRACER